jgi:hypothetical protein
MIDEDSLAASYRILVPTLNERQRRLWAAAEVRAAGRGGSAAVARATGLAADTIRRGVRELEAGEAPNSTRIRRSGAGRKALVASDAHLLRDIERLIDGDPRGPLRWTTRSVRELAAALHELGHAVHFTTLPDVLRGLGYSLRGTRRSNEGGARAERDLQLRYVSDRIAGALAEREPVIAVELMASRAGGSFESLGITDGTAPYAVAAIARWWATVGRDGHPAATALRIGADEAGLSGYRTRQWTAGLQGFADQTGLTLSVHHLPSATRRWNEIAHRSVTSAPAGPRRVIVSQIGSRRARPVATGHVRHLFRPDWNYTIRP